MMQALVAVCDTHLVTHEEQRRAELTAMRRRARYDRYRKKCNHKIETCDMDQAVSILYDGSQLDVRVQNPLTHIPTESSRFTTYEIGINTTNIAFTLPKSYVRRRYSDFVWLRHRLANDHGDVTPPSLPPKTWWGGQFEPAVIEQRLSGLQTFLQSILLERVYLSNKALHLFVQTQLYTREMEDVLSGLDKRSVANHIEEARKISLSYARCICCRKEQYEANNDICIDDVIDDEADATGARNIISDVHKHLLHTDDLIGSENALSPPKLSSTPQEAWNDSGLSEDSSLVTSSSENDCSNNPNCGTPSQTMSAQAGECNRLRPVLSQSLPDAMACLTSCSHRKRRVTFSTEVTVAKVVEKSDEEEDYEDVDMSEVILVKVNENKDKMKTQ